MAHEILLVDDEPDIRAAVDGILRDEGYETRQAADSDAALALFRARRPALVMLDIWLQGSKLDGIGILEAMHAEDPSVPVVMMSGHGTIETAVEATRIGAVDFLEKPIALQKLLNTIANALREGAPKPQMHIIEAQNHAAALNLDGPARQISLPLDLPLREARDHFDALYFDYHLQKEEGNVSRVADKVGLERTHLYRKLKQLGVKFAKKQAEDTSQ